MTTGEENVTLPPLQWKFVNYRSAHAMPMTCTYIVKIRFHVKSLRPLMKSNMKYAIRMCRTAHGSISDTHLHALNHRSPLNNTKGGYSDWHRPSPKDVSTELGIQSIH